MYEKDYILRIIRMAGQMLRAMLASLRENRPEDVLRESDEALTLIIGLPSALWESLTPGGLIQMLSVGGRFDAKRGRLAAEVYVRRAQAARMTALFEEADADAARALRLIEEVIAVGDDDDRAEAAALRDELLSSREPGAVPLEGELPEDAA